MLERIWHIFLDISPDLGMPLQATLTELVNMWPVQQECQRLWNELEEEEREGLLTLAKGDKLSPASAERQGLEIKGLVVERGEGNLVIFSPVFEAFVQQEIDRLRETAPRGLRYDAETRQIWLDDRDITRELSAEQYDLLAFMCQRAGVVCTKDEIAEAVWPDHSKEGITDAQIYQLVKRVREKVESDPHYPCYVVTARGRGYRIEEP